MTESTEEWPVGLRFKPTEDELIGHHLTKKLRGEMGPICVIPELYIYNCEPSELFTRYKELSSIPSDGSECFFFCPRGRKRKTKCGFWKETSTKRVIQALDTGEKLGLRRNLVYHKGRQRKAHRTNLGMFEYSLNSSVSESEISDTMEFVLCHIKRNRESKKAGSASAVTSTPANLTTPSILNDSENEGAQEISAQASPEMIVESENSNHTTSTYDLPDNGVPFPRQPDMPETESLFCSDRWFVDGTSDQRNAPGSPSDVIYLSDLWSFD